MSASLVGSEMCIRDSNNIAGTMYLLIYLTSILLRSNSFLFLGSIMYLLLYMFSVSVAGCMSKYTRAMYFLAQVC